LHVLTVTMSRKLEKNVHDSLERSLGIERIHTMRRRESSLYPSCNYVQPSQNSKSNEFFDWREQFCYWSYSLIDHYGISRKTVAISLDLFDRFVVTMRSSIDYNFALLTSLTTLYIAAKIHTTKKIKLNTLANLTKNRFCSQDIEKMEIMILQSLSWLVHPPTVEDFVCHFLKLLPAQVGTKVRKEIVDLLLYKADLVVCDPFFIEYPTSLIAYAAILNVMEYEIDSDYCQNDYLEIFLGDLYKALDCYKDRAAVKIVRDKLYNLEVPELENEWDF